MKTKRPVVDFIILGAAKSGTSTLYNYLKQHPKISASRNKEPSFFLPPGHPKRRIASLTRYEGLFKDGTDRLRFEASVSYTSDPKWNEIISALMYESNPKMKFVYILRNPIERIISGHRFLYKLGFIPRKERNINRHLKKDDSQVKISLYHSQLKGYIQTFGQEAIHVLTTDELKSDPLKSLNKILEFLNLKSIQSLPEGPKVVNSKSRVIVRKKHQKIYKLTAVKKLSGNKLYGLTKRIISPFVQRRITHADSIIEPEALLPYAPILISEIEQIEQLTSKDLTSWKMSINELISKKRTS